MEKQQKVKIRGAQKGAFLTWERSDTMEDISTRVTILETEVRSLKEGYSEMRSDTKELKDTLKEHNAHIIRLQASVNTILDNLNAIKGHGNKVIYSIIIPQIIVFLTMFLMRG